MYTRLQQIIRGTSTRTKLRKLQKIMRKRTKEEYATDSANKTLAKRKNGSSNAKKTKKSKKTVLYSKFTTNKKPWIRLKHRRIA